LPFKNSKTYYFIWTCHMSVWVRASSVVPSAVRRATSPPPACPPIGGLEPWSCPALYSLLSLLASLASMASLASSWSCRWCSDWCSCRCGRCCCCCCSPGAEHPCTKRAAALDAENPPSGRLRVIKAVHIFGSRLADNWPALLLTDLADIWQTRE
jgi:hypothetical protein